MEGRLGRAQEGVSFRSRRRVRTSNTTLERRTSTRTPERHGRRVGFATPQNNPCFKIVLQKQELWISADAGAEVKVRKLLLSIRLEGMEV